MSAYRTLSHLFNSLPVANDPKSIASFVRDMLPENIVADCRAVCKPVPNASAWLRVKEHAERLGVEAYILTEYRTEGGSWCTTAARNVREALDDRHSLTRRGMWGANTAAIVFVAGDAWMGGGLTRVMISANGTIDLSNDARTWHVVGHSLPEFLSELNADLAASVAE